MEGVRVAEGKMMGSLREKGKVKVVKGDGWEEGMSREKGRVHGRKRRRVKVVKGQVQVGKGKSER